MYSTIYANLSTRNVNKTEMDTIQNNFKEFYNFSSKISFYNPCLHLLTNYFTEEVGYNNKYKLIKLLKIKRRIEALGYIFKAKILSPNKHIFHKEIFVKELALLPVDKAHIYYRHNVSELGPYEKVYYDMVYNNNAPNNIEIFTTYLVSKIEELDVSPHFCKFYGCYNMIMDKFTYNVTSEPDITETKALGEILADNVDNCRYINSREGKFIEFSKYPCYLLATEKADLDMDFLYEQNILDYNFVKSIVFQIFSAVITMQNIYGLKHNDLHNGNIMLCLTDKTHFYYRFDNKYYKIPTYGYKIKIIDWGRATYDFNGHKGHNGIFDYYNDCFNQYRYDKINKRQRKPILPDSAKWTDIVMIAQNLLNLLVDFRDSDIGQLLFKLITYEKDKTLDIESFDWSMYKKISQYKWDHITPQLLVGNNLFKSYICSKKAIPPNQTTYIIQ